jgi:hypothetical protein
MNIHLVHDMILPNPKGKIAKQMEYLFGGVLLFQQINNNVPTNSNSFLDVIPQL